MNFDSGTVASRYGYKKTIPSDVSDEEWAFVAPYLALVREDAPWLQSPRSPTTGHVGGRLWLVLIPAALLLGAEGLCELSSHALCSAMLDCLTPRIFWSILLS